MILQMLRNNQCTQVDDSSRGLAARVHTNSNGVLTRYRGGEGGIRAEAAVKLGLGLALRVVCGGGNGVRVGVGRRGVGGEAVAYMQ